MLAVPYSWVYASRYKGWKSMLDPVLLREPSVKFYLNQALNMMNRAVAGNFQPGARENMAYFVSTERRLVIHTQEEEFILVCIVVA